MTDRDEFAKAVLTGLLAYYGNRKWAVDAALINLSYKWADALLAAGRADEPLPNDEIEAPADQLVDVSIFKRKERADKPDEWDEMAAGLLPCCDVGYFCKGADAPHASGCPASCRPAVAAKLRELAWEHKRIFDEAANDSERKLALIKAYKAQLAEAERERDSLREHVSYLHKRIVEVVQQRDEHKQAAFEMSADLERERAKYREAVELMRPVREWSVARDAEEHRYGKVWKDDDVWMGSSSGVPNAVPIRVRRAIARFVEAADKGA